MPLVRKGGVLTTLAKAVKQDPIGGSVLVDEVVYSYMADQAEFYRPEIEALLADFVQERVDVAKSVVADMDDETFEKNMAWLEGVERFMDAVELSQSISKSQRNEDWIINGKPVNRMVMRDVQGRFSASISQTSRRDPLSLSTGRISPKLLGSRVVADNGQMKYSADAGDKDVLERHQAQWNQANDVTADIYRNFGSSRDGVNIDLVILNEDGSSRVETVPLKSTKHGIPDSVNIDPLRDNILMVQVSTTDNDKAAMVAQFNALSSLGGPALTRLANVPEATWQQALGRYDLDSRNGSRLGQFFNRMLAGSQVLSAIPGSEKIAGAAYLVGTMGPEAERVLSPYVRQAAYRYRGTEKEPDADLVREFNSADMRRVDAIATSGTGSPEAAALVDALVPNKPGGKANTDIVQGSAAYRIALAERARRPFTRDELRMQVRSDVAARHLLNTLPSDPFVAEVSRKAGDVLPSQGILIDADGDVVSQAVGYADDHYLPFDLKNLASLRGGQYVRTRVQGGLTAEDIYASVALGSRMSTVVSSSGVFSIEFDPNFRGARANSDKARQMYDRYVKILDAVDGSGLYRKDIEPAKKAELRRQANMASAEKEEQDSIFEQMVERERQSQSSLTQEDLEQIQEAAQHEVMSSEAYKGRSQQSLARVIEDVYNEKVEEAQNAKVQALRLNSDGYKVALETLQQQFPYFIRDVSYEPLGSKGGGFLSARGQATAAGVRQRSGAEDQGYVRPGGMKAHALETGYYRTADEPRRKGSKGKSSEASSGDAKGVSEPKEQEKAPAGASAPSATNQTPLVAAHAIMEPVIAEARKKKLSELANFLPSLGFDQMNFGASDWQTVRGTPNAIKFIANRSVSEMEELLNSDPEGVISTLRDEKTVSNWFKSVMNDPRIGGMDYFSAGGTVGGKSRADEAATYMNELAQSIADLTALSHPFSDPAGTDSSAAFHVSDRPQGFKDIVSLDNPAKFKMYKDQNPDIAQLAVVLGWDDARDSYLPLSAVAANVNQKLSALQNVKRAQDIVMADLKANGHDVGRQAPRLPALVQGAGLTMDNLQSIIGHKIDDASDMGVGAYDPTKKALEVQRAWSLITAARLLTDMSGGDVLPKAQDAVLRKNSAVGRSSRQVRVVSKGHPLSLAVQHRRKAGLPLLV